MASAKLEPLIWIGPRARARPLALDAQRGTRPLWRCPNRTARSAHSGSSTSLLLTLASPTFSNRCNRYIFTPLPALFGSYKFFASKSPLKELGKMLLMIPLRTVKLSAEFVKDALEQVRATDVEDWSQELFGPSALAARRAALGSPKKT